MRFAGKIGVVVIALIGAVVVSACDAEDDDLLGADERGATVIDILDDPRLYAGRTVTLFDEVGDVAGPFAFTMETGGNTPGLEDDLLVVSPVPLSRVFATRLGRGPAPFDEEGGFGVGLLQEALRNVEVEVRGEVRVFDVREFEDELGIDLDDPLYLGLEGGPALLVRTWLQPFVPARIDEPTVADPGPVIAPIRLIDNPQEFIGEVVTVRARVADVLGPNGFVLETGEMLVVASRTSVPRGLSPSDLVTVTGRFDWFDRIPAERAIGAQLNVEEYRIFSGRPSIIASRVQLVSLGR